jgi:alpha-1,3-mannosylglycoprotein beta-1,4-N-acetylglucosaminyltransferase A/B
LLRIKTNKQISLFNHFINFKIHCERSKHDLKIKFKPSLFQHVGVESSLKGKKQKLKDKDFGKQSLIIAHDNPTAKLSTSLKTYMKQTLQSVYLGQNFFWSMAPVANDFVLFEFDKPTNIYKYT